MNKRQVYCNIDEKLFKEFEKIRDETGLPIARLIDLKLRGFKVVRM